jgi:hypothetical protein
MDEAKSFEIALIKYASSGDDKEFVDKLVDGLYDLQTDIEKQLGRSIHRNNQGVDSGDAGREVSMMTFDEKVDIIAKYTRQCIELIESGVVKAPDALMCPIKIRPRSPCKHTPMDFRETDDRPVKPRRIRPHRVTSKNFVVDDSTIVFEDGTHVGHLSDPGDSDSEEESETEDDPNPKRRTSARLAKRAKVIADSESDKSDEEHEEEEEGDGEPSEHGTNVTVTMHGIWKRNRLAVPSAAFVETVMRVQDEVVKEARRKKKRSWNPEEVFDRILPMFQSVGNEIDIETLDAILYSKLAMNVVTPETRGVCRVFARGEWMSVTVISCTVYCFGFQKLTIKDESNKEWCTDASMLYSLEI